jgi:DNA-binding IclR family transcriptional regulator
MTSTDADSRSPVRSVARAVDLLVALGRGPQQLGPLSAEVGLSKATAYRILTTFRQKEMVLQDSSSGAYQLGPACIHLASSLVDGRAGFPFDAEKELDGLRSSTGETVTVHVRLGPSRICIRELPSSQAIRYTAGLGATVGVHVGSAGKVLLAFMADADRSRLLQSLDLQPLTSSTIHDRNSLLTELEDIRRRGVAVSKGERVEGAVGVSAPVFDSAGRILAAVSVLGPESRLGPEQVERAEILVRDTTARITKRIESV